MTTIAPLRREGLLPRGYRSVDEKLLPGVKLLDYAEVAKVQIKQLKSVVHYILGVLRPLPKRLFAPASNVRGCSFRGHGLVSRRALTQFAIGNFEHIY